MSADPALTPWAQLREQWQASRLVRLGAWAGVALLALYLLLAGFDEADALLERNRAQAAELVRLQALAKDTAWPERRQEAQALKAAYDTAVWSDGDLALAEAGLQDWLRTVTQRLGLKVREITLVRADPSAKPSGSVPPGYVELHARVVVEVQRVPLFALLAEMSSQERRIVVERFALRGMSQPSVAEMDLKALALAGAKP